jgi:hypothetical protein
VINYSSIQVSEGSVTEPVSLDEAKAWLQIDLTDHDALLTSMIKGARTSIENYLNLHLVEKTVELDVEFTGDSQKAIPLPYTFGLSSVVVDELDDTDQTTTLTVGTDFFVRGNLVRLLPGRYHVSYTTVPGTIPEDLKEAIKMEVAERFAQRGENPTFRTASATDAATTGLSESAKAKADPYKILWL